MGMKNEVQGGNAIIDLILLLSLYLFIFFFGFRELSQFDRASATIDS